MIQIEVDFNSRDESGLVPAALDTSTGIRVGDEVELYDEEGNRCPAVVAAIITDESRLALQPMWQAFAGPDETLVLVTWVSRVLWADWVNRMTMTLGVSTRRPFREPTSGGGSTATTELTDPARVLVG